jgi:hypothetical protein
MFRGLRGRIDTVVIHMESLPLDGPREGVSH